MKVSKQQAAENRETIVQVAAAQVRERGFSHMSVADVAKAAGLTHGALYSHFASKEALQAAAIERAFEDCLADFSGLTPEQFLARYLSAQHRDDAGHGCPAAALLSEVRWQPQETRTAFRDGLIRFATLTSKIFGAGEQDSKQDLTMLVFAAMSGGLAMSRAIRGVDEAASDTILLTVMGQVRLVMTGSADAHSQPPRRAGAKNRPAAKPRNKSAATAPVRPATSG